MISGKSIITVVINKGEKTRRVNLEFSGKITDSRLLYSNKKGKIRADKLQIDPEETMVIQWIL